jgi:PAS domain S-box-containing protein
MEGTSRNKRDRPLPSGDILVVDDEITNLRMLGELLGREGYAVRRADRPQLAIDSALARPPSLILLDVRMPEMDGFEVCRRLRQDSRTRGVPIIFASALRDTSDLVRGFDAGGQDFISKPFQEREILARVRIHLELHTLRPNLESQVTDRTAELKAAHDALKLEITERMRVQQSLEEALSRARVGCWSWDVEPDVVTWSKTMRELVGWELDSPPPSYEENRKLFAERSWEQLTDAVAGAVESAEPYELDLCMQRLDGKTFQAIVRGAAVRDATGRVVKLHGTVQDITEWKHAERALRQIQEKVGGFVEQSPVAFELYDTDGFLIEVNPAFEKLWSLSREDVIGRFNLLQSEQVIAKGFVPHFERALAGEDVIAPDLEFDARLEQVDHCERSRSRWVSSRLYPVRDIDGNVTHVVVMHEDITEQKQADENLEELRAYTDHLVETASVMIVSLDARGRVTRFNPAAETITGYTLAEVEGKDWFELLVPRDRYPEVHEEFARLTKGGLPQVFENPIVTKAGEERHISWRNSEVTKSGAIAGVTSFGIDITERKKAQKALKEGEEKFRQMLVQSPLSIEIHSPAGYIEEANQAWMDLWGVEDEEGLLALKASWCILEDEQLTSLGVMPLVERAFRGERVVLPEFEYDAGPAFEKAGLPVARAKKRWVRTHLYPVLGANGETRHVVDVEEDITERKQSEERVRNYQDRLRALASELTLTEEQERKRIATELHDGAAQSLALARIQLVSARKTVEEPAARTKLDDLSQLLKESLQQIRDVLLDLSSPALSEIGLAAALSEWLEEHIGRRHGLRTSFDDRAGVAPLTEDVRAVLFRNVRELLINAVKHAEARMVSVRMESDGGTLQITVQDDGVGFDAGSGADRPSNEGAFGLFSVRERMADMGGSLEIVSAPGEGTRATLIAPLASPGEGSSS